MSRVAKFRGSIMHVTTTITLTEAIRAVASGAVTSSDRQLNERQARKLEEAAAVIRRRLALQECQPHAASIPEWLAGPEWNAGEGGDASKANGEFFQWRVKEKEKGTQIYVVCPSFLRGPLGFRMDGRFLGASY
jgi:hypothetical protein